MPDRFLKFKRILAKFCLVLLSALVSVFLCDWVLAALGYPSVPPEYSGHPSNYEEVRHNIEFDYVFHTNSQGLRYREIPLEKTPGTRRIFVSGDSFTEGDGVSDENRFTNLLETEFKEISVINGGLAGAGPLQYGKFFLDVAPRYSPDGLLICVFVNDIADTWEDESTPKILDAPPRSIVGRLAGTLWPRIYSQIKGFILRREYLSRTHTNDFVGTITHEARARGISEQEIENWRQHLPKDLVDASNRHEFEASILSLGLLYPDYWIDSIDISTDRARKKWNNMSAILSRVVERGKDQNVESAVVLIPSKFQYNPKCHAPSDPYIAAGTKVDPKWLVTETEIQRRMRQWAEAAGVPFLDLTPVFREAVKSDTGLDFVHDLHWTPRGHRVAADAIFDWLTTRKVFSFIQRKENEGFRTGQKLYLRTNLRKNKKGRS